MKMKKKKVISALIIGILAIVGTLYIQYSQNNQPNNISRNSKQVYRVSGIMNNSK
ncbi:hypothetical protein [Carnobacterium maltaromaticum]|uniref:hypothetical protein n=1 Tax=Carnobacterium maltaromaticum TaxID=2751 RepID=UPI001E5213E8|nr:hypothetical protein [Carnobacterium maltaromaticum]